MNAPTSSMLALNSNATADNPSVVVPPLDPKTVAEACHQIEELHDRCAYLDALKLGQERLGPDLHAWPTVEGQVLAARLAGRLGGHQRRSVMLYLIGRRHPEHPQAQYFAALSDIERRPFARVWLQMRDHELETPDARLQACWVGLKARLMAGMRDFDRATSYARQALDLAPDEPWIHVNHAGVLSAQDDLDGSISACKDALALAPQYGPAVQSLGHYWTELNRIDDALDLLAPGSDRRTMR